jgi:hypothetical protein
MLAYLIGVKTINVGIKPWFLIFCWFFHESYQFFDVFELTRTKSLLFWKLKKIKTTLVTLKIKITTCISLVKTNVGKFLNAHLVFNP